MALLDSISDLVSGSGPKTSNDRFQKGLTELRTYDVGRTSYFQVQIFSRIGGSGADNESLSYLCHSAELPGEATATVVQKIYGVDEKFPVRTAYNDITLSFYTRGSKKEIVRSFFLKWLAFITGRGEILGSGSTTYNVKYKEKYVTDIVITQYAITGDPLVKVKLIDAFPVAINQVPLSWSSQNQAQSLNVSFAYTEYEYQFISVENNGNYTRGPIGELIGLGIKTAATINSIKGAIDSGNPIAGLSTLPGLSTIKGLGGLSNFTLSSGLNKIGLG
jgi:hypothetical protein